MSEIHIRCGHKFRLPHVLCLGWGRGLCFFRSFFMSEAVSFPPGPRAPVKTDTGEDFRKDRIYYYLFFLCLFGNSWYVNFFFFKKKKTFWARNQTYSPPPKAALLLFSTVPRIEGPVFPCMRRAIVSYSQPIRMSDLTLSISSSGVTRGPWITDFRHWAFPEVPEVAIFGADQQ